MSANDEFGTLEPLGVSATTGRPLSGLTESAVESKADRERFVGPDQTALAARGNRGAEAAYAVVGGVEARDLGQAGWGVIYGPNVDQRIKDALKPLLDHRRDHDKAAPFVVFDGECGYRAGDTAQSWLHRRKVANDVVRPERGVPFYLLIVAAPADVPFEFQYSLDIYWAVGRLWFDAADDFRRYAESVVAYETQTTVAAKRRVTIFAPEHDFDSATQLFTRYVARPLAEGEPPLLPFWERPGFALQPFLGAAAKKDTLANVFRRKEDGPPALLVTGSHGMDFDLGDPRQHDCQGAIVCQDWSGFGSIQAAHWFAASDVPPDAHLHGMIHFFFACHSGGWTEFDDFDRLNATPRKISPEPSCSKLPQALLAHPNGGALAVLAHVERAWTYSFQTQRKLPQLNGFEDVLVRLLLGERIGQATDTFNLRWAKIATELSDLQGQRERGTDVPLTALGNLWAARDDARNYVILGDPAVRLRVEDMPRL